MWIDYKPPTADLREQAIHRMSEATADIDNPRQRAKATIDALSEIICEQLQSWEFEGVEKEDTPKWEPETKRATASA